MAFNIGPKIGIEGEEALREAIRRIIAEFKTLDESLKTMETAFKRGEASEEAYAKYQDTIGEGFVVLNKLANEYVTALDASTNKYGEGSKEAEKYQNELTKVGTKIEEYRNKSKNAEEQQETFNEKLQKTEEALSALETALLAAGVVKGFEKLKEALEACVTASAQFEASMAAVSRTTGLTGVDLENMGETLKNLSTEIPITQNELASVVTTAGQLGIATSEIEDFSVVMAKLGTSTDLTADSAATLLAQFVNITGTTDFERLGSTVAALGDETATTASRIVEMSQRLAGAASVAGMSERDILAISAAVSALGVRSQAGGTAFSTLIQNMYKAVETGEGLEELASVANMTAGQFKAAWGTDAVQALNAFIKGLNDVERNGKNGIVVLDELGISNQRQTSAVLGLAEAGDLLTRTIEKSNDAWSANTALNAKAATMYGTTEAKFTMFKNSVSNLEIAIGDALTPALAELAESGTNAINWASEFVEKNPEVVYAVTALTTALGLLVGGLTATAVAIKAIQGLKSIVALIGGGSTVAFMAAAAAIAGVVVALTAYAESCNSAINATQDLQKDIKESKQTFEENNRSIEENTADAKKLTAELSKLSSKEQKSAADKKLIQIYVDKLNESLPELALNYDTTTDSLYGLDNATDLTVEKIDEYIEARKRQEEAESNLDRVLEIENQKAAALEALQALEEERAELAARGLSESSAAIITYDQQINYLKEDIATLSFEENELKNRTVEYAEATAAAEEQQEAMNAILFDTQMKIDELATAYEEAYKKVKSSLDGQATLLDKLERSSTTSAETIIGNLKSQENYWSEYSANLDKLLNSGVDGVEKLALQFSDGSEKSAAALAGLADATPEEIEKILESLDSTENFKEQLSDQFAEAETNASKSISELVKDAKSELKKLELSNDTYRSGVDTIDGYIDGLNNRSGRLYSKIYSIARSTISTMNRGLDINSPSKEFAKIGQFTMLGFIQGVDDMEHDVAKTMQDSARGVINSFNASTGFDDISGGMSTSSDIAARFGGANSAGTTNNTTNMGGINFTINASPGQDVEELAGLIADEIQAIADRKEAAIA